MNVGIWYDAPFEYSGGLNYFRNLLYALSLVNDGSIRMYIFFSDQVSKDVEDDFSKFAIVKKTSILRKNSLLWFINKIDVKINLGLMINILLIINKINVLSHVWFKFSRIKLVKLIGWIPDFQSMHLPNNFAKNTAEKELELNKLIINQSDIVLLSSNDALKDYNSITSECLINKARVLQFVSQSNFKNSKIIDKKYILKKYMLTDKFFLLPNQFWAHKNHLIVLKSVLRLKEIGVNVKVVCTGNTQDFRDKNSNYFKSICNFIDNNNLSNNVNILGLIDYGDMLNLMHYSLAVINPSSFEGWSSTVEEARSMGKTIILSNIGVHIEQRPTKAHYFDLYDDAMLANILLHIWQNPPKALTSSEIDLCAVDAKERTVEFGYKYYTFLKNLLI